MGQNSLLMALERDIVMSEVILLVEDEESIRKFTKINLEREGFQVYEAESGELGVELALAHKPDVVILDVMLPGIDGYEVCSILRSKMPNLGIIMLTAKTQEVDKILGLEQGSDDYMVKPFNPKELVLRIKSLLRRIRSNDEKKNENLIEDSVFRLDLQARALFKNNTEIDLTPTEFALLKIFLSNPNRAFSRNELLDLTWGNEFVSETKIVDVNIRRIRSKIEDQPAKPVFLETVWGVGYRWRSAD